MILTIGFIILSVILIISLFTILVLSLIYFINKTRNKQNNGVKEKIKKGIILFFVIAFFNISLVFSSQILASTPKIITEEKNSVSELIKVDLNGRKEWISIRGENKENPILLFLAGGPGGSQMAAVRYDLAALEDSFIVVNWDQPGSAKSYSANKGKDITLDTYLEDGVELTKYLINRFSKEKIYLVGESWGSALGLLLVNKYPSLYYSFIGTGQMINFKETEIQDYNKVLELAKERGQKEVVEKLIKNGIPPYFGKDVTWKSATYLNYLSTEMQRNPLIKNSGYNTFRDVFSQEYGIIDKINYFRGIINTFNSVYQQLYEIDLRNDVKKSEVPVYFFIGRHDINAPTSLVEDYYNKLEAPQKELIWFEKSGHSPWINESDKFINELKMKFTEHRK